MRTSHWEVINTTNIHFKRLTISLRLRQVTTSKQKKFPLITFVDTPGLVDGEMLYPFDVDQAIQWMGRKLVVFWVCYGIIVHCTFALCIYIVHLHCTFALYIVHLYCTLYILIVHLHSTFYILHFTFYILHFTFYILHFTFYILHCTLYCI